jgi:hypothetical protein
MAVARGRLPGLLGEPRQHLGSAASAGELLRSLVLTRLVEVDDHDAATAPAIPTFRGRAFHPSVIVSGSRVAAFSQSLTSQHQHPA